MVKEIVKAVSACVVMFSGMVVFSLLMVEAEHRLKKVRWLTEFVVSATLAVVMFVVLCLNCYYLRGSTLGVIAALVEVVWVLGAGLMAVVFYEESRGP